MKEVIKQICGDVAVRAFPKVSDSIARGDTVPRGSLEKLISSSLIRQAALSGDHKSLRNRLSRYWQGDAGDSFYDKFADRFESSFLGGHYPLVEALIDVVNSSEGELTQLYEIGCGDGRVLHHLSGKLEGVNRFTGLDINEMIIKKNRDTYAGTSLQFHSGDATALLKEAALPGSIVMSYGGVMEYFLEEELAAMFAMLKEKSPVAVALVEPLYDGYDPSVETESRPSGLELSFSHNHRHLLEQAGFTVQFQSQPEMEFRWMMIVAQG